MKKNAFISLFCLLFAIAGYAQNPVNITGVVTNLSTGAPAANHLVYCIAGDSLVQSYGDALTGADGSYSISMGLPPGYDQVEVATLAYCDPANPFISTVVNVVNGGATANFQICNDSLPPFEQCFADFYITPLDSLTFQFTGYYYSFFDSSQAVSYTWDFGDGATSTEVNPTHVYAQGGLYFVTLTVMGANGCVATVQYPFETSFNTFPECMGYILYTQTDSMSFDFTAEIFDQNGNLVPAASYNWDFGDGDISTDPNPSHTYAFDGVFTVQLHAITDSGCEIHSCDVVFTGNNPIDTFWYGCQAMFSTGIMWPDSMGNPNGGGDSLTVSFIDLSLGGVVTWAWDFGDSTNSTEQNPVHTYAAGGLYHVSLAITTVDGCESDISFEICVGSNCGMTGGSCQALFIPIPDSLGGNGLQFLDLSISNEPIQGWLWDFGDGTISTEQNPFHVYAQAGVYTVSLTIEAFMCYSVITFEIDTENPWNFGIDSNGNLAQLGVSAGTIATKEAVVAFNSAKLFPNPAHDDLTVAFNSTRAAAYEFNITDLSGRTMASNRQEALAGLNAAHLNISNLDPGFYLAQIRSGDAIQTIKFVKQ